MYRTQHETVDVEPGEHGYVFIEGGGECRPHMPMVEALEREMKPSSMMMEHREKHHNVCSIEGYHYQVG